jgi:lipopolysaccharide export system protein LptA
MLKKLLILIVLVATFCWNCTAKERYRIVSESSQIDLAKQIVVYSGNASFSGDDLLIEGNQIEAFTVNDRISKIKVTGNPARLNQKNIGEGNNPVVLPKDSAQTELKSIALTANIIIYETTNNHLIAQESVKLEINALDKSNEAPSNAYFKATGQSLNLSTASNAEIELTGSPVSIWIDQNNLVLEAAANRMNYAVATEKLELLEDVNLSTSAEKIKAQKILYDGKTQFLEIPKVPNQQVEMIQRKKQTNE